MIITFKNSSKLLNKSNLYFVLMKLFNIHPMACFVSCTYNIYQLKK